MTAWFKGGRALATNQAVRKVATAANNQKKARAASEFQGNMVLGGVGGQGIITASNTISFVCIEAGLDVKKSEVHGMSQRGGAVVSHLRFGPEVHSVMLEPGQAEWILGFEWEEGLRYLEYLKPGGVAFVSIEQRIPPSAQVDRRGGRIDYALELEPPAGVVPVDTYQIAGNSAIKRPASAQSVLLGALSVEMGLPVELWEKAMAATVPPKTLEANLLSFENGRVWYELWKRNPISRRSASLHSDEISRNSHNGSGASGLGRHDNPTEGTIQAWRGGIPRVEIRRDWCKGCNICVSLCPERVLSMDRHEIAVASNPDRCTGCGLCVRLCPDFAVDVWLDTPASDEPVQIIAHKRGDHR
jgi:indolepyruvate ferredoxin oxidoreductase beta subunit